MYGYRGVARGEGHGVYASPDNASIKTRERRSISVKQN